MTDENALKNDAPGEKKKPMFFREGVVLKAKMQKTVIVEVVRLVQHTKFKKIIRSRVRYAVHDEKGEAKVGDKVRIVRTRPLSKTKCWRIVQVLGQ